MARQLIRFQDPMPSSKPLWNEAAIPDRECTGSDSRTFINFELIPPPKNRNTITHSYQVGLSLIELMIGITLGLMVTISLGYILIGSRTSFQTQDASARMQESGRAALDNLLRDLRFAGRTSIIPVTKDLRIEWDSTVLAIEGTDGTSNAPDTLTVRYQVDDVGCNRSASSDSDCRSRAPDCNGDNGTASTLYTNRGVISGTEASGDPYNYYTVVNTYSVSGNSLQCLGNGGGFVQPFVDNVEDFQVTYGLDLDGDSAPNRYISAPSSSTDWSQVVTVRICILIRSDSGAAKSAQAYTNCSGTNQAPDATDTRLRRAYTSVVSLRNRNRASE